MKIILRIIAAAIAIYLIPAGILSGSVIGHRIKWSNQKIVDYRITVTEINSKRTYNYSYVEAVKNGKLIGRSDTTAIDALFERAQDCALWWPIRYLILGCSVTYDPIYGYPSQVEYDARRWAENEYYLLGVKDFTPEPSPQTGNQPPSSR